jgi:hypothetical protein
MNLSNYNQIQDILSGQNDISDHVKNIVKGHLYSDEEYGSFVSSMYDVLNDSLHLKKMIFFDFLKKDEKLDFISKHLDIAPSVSPALTPKSRIQVTPKSQDVIEFVKKDFYCEGLAGLYSCIYPMHRISPESFIAVWSISVANGTFTTLLNEFKGEVPIEPLRKKKRR